jgi:limonene-1,2-epoxide hydrolase
MSAPSGIERRDPCGPVLRLGAVLAAARRERSNGIVEVVDHGRAHTVRVVQGAIADVVSELGGPEREAVSRRAARLFGLERPRVAFTPLPFGCGAGDRADPDQVVVDGVRARGDVFDPVRLVERIPVPALRVRPEKRALIARLGLADDELELVDALRTPTPIQLVLWKRGLDPRRAGALIVALNLVGVFDADWKPGLLPRLTAALRVLERAAAGATDRELLGAACEDDPREEDRAFRKLTLELHPDRLRGLPLDEARMAEEAIRHVTAAYERLKRSRRSPAVRGGDAIARVNLVRRAPDGWAELLEITRSCFAVGDVPRARAFAVKALAMSPPPEARAELLAALTRAA